MNIPSEIRAGDTVKWRDNSATDVFGNEIKSDEWTLTYYLRFNHTHEAHTTVGTAYGTDWEFTISATDSAGFDAGSWYWQAIATKGAEKITLGYGSLEVEPSLSYTGQAIAMTAGRRSRKILKQFSLLFAL